MEFVDNYRNYIFSKMDKNDIKEYLEFLNHYLIEYRDMINLNKKITFGLEFEYEDIDKSIIDRFIETKLPLYCSDFEEEFETGGEIKSPPLYDNKETWLEIKQVCDYLKKNNAVVDISAGSHVHVSVSELGKNIEKFKQFILLYIAYEHILYRFSNGERIDTRRNQIATSYPISLMIAPMCKEILRIKDYEELKILLVDSSSRFQGLNLKNIKFNEITKNTIKNTIEFRMANGTKEEIIWQNLVNTYTKMINSSIKKSFDIDKLRYKIRRMNDIYLNYGYFDGIYIDEALEFVDIIFDNNLDKTNFLKQYIKDKRLERSCKKDIPTYSKIIMK